MSVDVAHRMAAQDWARVDTELNQGGLAVLPQVLRADECTELAALYADAAHFRSRIVMQRHGFGMGEYQYFGYPLPPLLGALRGALYEALVPIANAWHQRMGLAARFPPRHEAFLRRCHAAGQIRPTPLLVRYQAGDYNCLHQDLYGEHVFPLQAVCLLARPAEDFTGGELVLTEQRPRMQSRVEVVPLRQGDMALIAVHQRPHTGTRGDYRVTMRHGVSRVRSGQRHTLGIIFHDAA